MEADLGEVSCLLYSERLEFINVNTSPTERGDEFTKLTDIGVKILPLVVHNCAATLRQKLLHCVSYSLLTGIDRVIEQI